MHIPKQYSFLYIESHQGGEIYHLKQLFFTFFRSNRIAVTRKGLEDALMKTQNSIQGFYWTTISDD